jgi:hypothetical protein
MRKVFILLLAFFLIIPISFACKDVYRPQEEVIINDVIVNEGLGAECNITTFASNQSLIDNQTMTRTGLFYNASLGELELGNYISSINCELDMVKYYGECNFKVERDDRKMIAITMFGIFLILILLGLAGLGFYLWVEQNEQK